MLTGIYTAFRKKRGCLLGLLAFASAYIVINALVVEDVADTIYRYRSVIVGTSLLFIDGNVFKTVSIHLFQFLRGRIGKRIHSISLFR